MGVELPLDADGDDDENGGGGWRHDPWPPLDGNLAQALGIMKSLSLYNIRQPPICMLDEERDNEDSSSPASPQVPLLSTPLRPPPPPPTLFCMRRFHIILTSFLASHMSLAQREEHSYITVSKHISCVIYSYLIRSFFTQRTTGGEETDGALPGLFRLCLSA